MLPQVSAVVAASNGQKDAVKGSTAAGTAAAQPQFRKRRDESQEAVLKKKTRSLKSRLRTYFTFDGTIYEQVEGTPMGSPISGFIAEAVLQRLESLVFRHHRPKFWAWYVGDTFVVIDRDQLLTFKERLNAVFPDTQFTMEEEENNQLAALDVLVCRKDCGGLKTRVFRR
ncbi:hypothetical protein SprV_0802576100 [Sparganum proliferum]